jgi:hypothetical protein
MVSSTLKLFVFPVLMAMSCQAFTIQTSTRITIAPNLSTKTNTLATFSQPQKENFQSQSWSSSSTGTSLSMSEESSTPKKSNLPMLLDVGTKGGALFLSLLLFIVPIIGYEVATTAFGIDGIEAGKWIGVGFTLFTLVLWVGSYIFRVATKDMTYVSFVISSEREGMKHKE